MTPLYIVVYGLEYEDMMYFTCFKKAQICLVIHSAEKSGFFPVMYEYADLESNGQLVQCKHNWKVCHVKLHELEMSAYDVYDAPHKAISAIVKRLVF